MSAKRETFEVTITDEFMDNTCQPIYRVRRDGLMVACIHYRMNRADRVRISRTQARGIAAAIAKAAKGRIR